MRFALCSGFVRALVYAKILHPAIAASPVLSNKQESPGRRRIDAVA